MKCLTVKQPHAMLLVIGAKRYETRDWRTDHVGDLAIHAARGFSEEERALCRQEPFRSALLRAGYRYPADLPTGAVIGIVCLVGCRPVVQVLPQLKDDAPERAFGDFANVRWAWELTQPRQIPPQACRGRLGIFEASVQLPPLDRE